MKALLANYSLGREVWDRFKSKFRKQADGSHAVSIELAHVPEPTLVGPQWVKIRSILSGISSMDEGLFLRHDPSVFAPFLSFPFIPGNEVMGIVTDMGDRVEGVELGQRVVVNPLLSCEPRGVTPLCPSCSSGHPSACRSFSKGSVGPGVAIGACADVGGGWGDELLAHSSQVRAIPPEIESEQAILAPEFTRAVRAVLQFPPKPGDRVMVMGAGSLGLLTLIAIRALGHNPDMIVVAEHSFEADLVRSISNATVVMAHAAGASYEEVAAFVKGTVRYPEVGRLTIEGGADIVYETTGMQDRMEDAIRFVGERKQLVLMNPTHTLGFDMAPLWLKQVKMHGTLFSGRESYEGQTRETFDVAMELLASASLPVNDIITHRVRMEDFRQGLSTLADRSTSKAVKVVLTHVV
jgi:threonine dehydrogenase-like Zn-dependent dehydrogenase